MRGELFASIAFGLVPSSAASSPENVPLAAGQRTGRPSSRCNEPLSPSMPRPQRWSSGCKRSRRLGDVGGDCIHQGRRQAVVGFQMQLDSMTEETNAANSGGAQPWSFESSVWMKSNP